MSYKSDWARNRKREIEIMLIDRTLPIIQGVISAVLSLELPLTCLSDIKTAKAVKKKIARQVRYLMLQLRGWHVMYYINLQCMPLEVVEYDPEVYAADLKEWGQDLDDYDFKVFTSLESANEFLESFKSHYSKLKDHITVKGPCLIYKRRYLVLTSMGLKLQTFRSYKKQWTPGTVINLYDQTYFLPVKLTSIDSCEEGFKYSFKLL
jgi:hypothetical protein